MDAVSDVSFIPEHTFYLRNRPGVCLIRGCFRVDVGEGAVPLVIQPTGCGHLFTHQCLGDFRGSCTVSCKVKDFFDDPPGFLVDNQFVPQLRVLFVSKRRICTDFLPCGKLGMQCGLDFSAGVLGVPLVEHTSFGKVKRKQQKSSIHAGLRRDGSRSDTSLSDSQGAEITIA